jgi:hypothetical protein
MLSRLIGGNVLVIAGYVVEMRFSLTSGLLTALYKAIAVVRVGPNVTKEDILNLFVCFFGDGKFTLTFYGRLEQGYCCLCLCKP